MASHCAVFNCDLKGVGHHKFPKDPELREKWECAMKRVNPRTGNHWKASPWSVVCKDHFLPTDYIPIGVKTQRGREHKKLILKEDAVPSQFLWNQEENGHLQEASPDVEDRSCASGAPMCTCNDSTSGEDSSDGSDESSDDSSGTASGSNTEMTPGQTGRAKQHVHSGSQMSQCTCKPGDREDRSTSSLKDASTQCSLVVLPARKKASVGVQVTLPEVCLENMTEEEARFCTGLPSKETFREICQSFSQPHVDLMSPGGRPNRLRASDVLLFLLMRIHLGLKYQDLAMRFHVSAEAVRQACSKWLKQLPILRDHPDFSISEEISWTEKMDLKHAVDRTGVNHSLEKDSALPDLLFDESLIENRSPPSQPMEIQRNSGHDTPESETAAERTECQESRSGSLHVDMTKTAEISCQTPLDVDMDLMENDKCADVPVNSAEDEMEEDMSDPDDTFLSLGSAGDKSDGESKVPYSPASTAECPLRRQGVTTCYCSICVKKGLQGYRKKAPKYIIIPKKPSLRPVSACPACGLNLSKTHMKGVRRHLASHFCYDMAKDVVLLWTRSVTPDRLASFKLSKEGVLVPKSLDQSAANTSDSRLDDADNDQQQVEIGEGHQNPETNTPPSSSAESDQKAEQVGIDSFDYFNETVPFSTTVVDAQNFMYTCTMCRLKFMLRNNQRAHLSARHLGQPVIYDLDDMSLKLTPEEDRSLLCDICGAVYRSIMGLACHRKLHFDPNAFQCDVCFMCLANRNSLIDHKKLHERDLNGVPFEREKMTMCEVCGKGFKSRQALKVHMVNHGATLSYTCEFCSQKFSSFVNLKTHKKEVHVLRKIECKLCGAEFHRMLDLKSHTYKVHVRNKEKLTVKSWTCKHCSKTFSSERMCALHEKWHEEDVNSDSEEDDFSEEMYDSGENSDSL